MSKYYTDKNGFTAEVGSDWNDEKSDQTLAYLTSPRTKFSKEDNSSVIVVNGELTTENEVKKRIEKEEAAKKLNPIGNRIIQYSNIVYAAGFCLVVISVIFQKPGCFSGKIWAE